MKKLFGFGLPDMGKLTAMFDEKFEELIRHIDVGFAGVITKLEELKAQQGDHQ